MKPIRKLWALLLLIANFAMDLFGSTWEVARIVLSPGIRTRPAIIMMPVEVKRPWAVTMLAYFTTITPGSTCLHVSEDHKRLYLHILDLSDKDATIAKFRRLYERRIAELEQ